jgi:chorismate synthase
MSGNVFGKDFQIMTFGESHGEAIGVVIDGVKPGLKISEKEIQKELDRRRPGQSKVSTSRKESDKIHILSGIFKGKTTGTPICMIVRNKGAISSDYDLIKDMFRPGQADFTYLKKYGIRDYRGGGRASGRETAGRVAAGAIAKKILSKKRVKIQAYTIQVGNEFAKSFDEKEIERNSVRCPDAAAAKRMEKIILAAKANGDSVGGVVEIVARNVPIGLGEPVFGKLDAELAKALVSIGAVKGVEFGAGFAVAELKGSECNDEMRSKAGKVKFKSNNAGGILGGISTGQDIVIRVAVKPTASISVEQDTVDLKGKNKKIKTNGRHDPCICPRIVPVTEAMVALVLADALAVQQARKKKN